jgi:hypothetical protein
MKHYFAPFNYGGVESYEMRFKEPIFSPVDGVVLYIAEGDGDEYHAWVSDYEQKTGLRPPSDYLDRKIYIRPDEAPNLWVSLHHISPIEEIINSVSSFKTSELMLGIAIPAPLGHRITAGDIIGYGIGEISVEKHLDGNGVPSPCNSETDRSRWGDMPGCKTKRKFHSIFEFMTDQVFDQYRAIANVSREDFITSAEERSADPLRCKGQNFTDRDSGAYIYLQGNGEKETLSMSDAVMIEETASQETQLPDISYFANNKSDRFLVDFEDIIAGHPFVGQRSPVPHNDAQVYFSNSDPRWLGATKPSDYPPIYAVADGVIAMAEGEMSYYNIRDKTFWDPPWYHVHYGFNLRFATMDGEPLVINYSLEPYVTLEGKSRDFFKQFLLVEDGQKVKNGDLLAYMYVPPFEERISGPASSHVAFTMMKEQGNPWDVFPPAIFTKEIVDQFSGIYRNPTEGWDSTSYGRDWSRARGLPPAMGWMIEASENPFSDAPLDVLIYDGVRDAELDGTPILSPQEIGFAASDIIHSFSGYSNEVTDEFEISGEWRAIIASLGGPIEINMTIFENNGTGRYRKQYSSNQGMGFSTSLTPAMSPGSFKYNISNPGGWPWAIAIASTSSPHSISGENLPAGFCPPDCPPLPADFDGPEANIGNKISYK